MAHLKDEIKIEGWEGDPMDKCITYIDDIEFDMNSNKVNTAFETDCSGTDVVTICKKKIGKFELTCFLTDNLITLSWNDRQILFFANMIMILFQNSSQSEENIRATKKGTKRGLEPFLEGTKLTLEGAKKEFWKEQKF